MFLIPLRPPLPDGQSFVLYNPRGARKPAPLGPDLTFFLDSDSVFDIFNIAVFHGKKKLSYYR